MDKVVASDHPDCAGGIVWSACELRWINSKIEQQAERIHELEVRLSGKTGYCVQCEALAAQNEKLREVVDAAKNLIAQKGRHNTHIAYMRLSEAIDAAIDAERKEGA